MTKFEKFFILSGFVVSLFALINSCQANNRFHALEKQKYEVESDFRDSLASPHLNFIILPNDVEGGRASIFIQNGGTVAANIEASYYYAADFNFDNENLNPDIEYGFSILPPKNFRILPNHQHKIVEIQMKNKSNLHAIRRLKNIKFAICYSGIGSERSWMTNKIEGSFSDKMQEFEKKKGC